MSLKQHIGVALAAISMLSIGAMASAQTTDTTTMQTTATTTPGVPNTGAGGDAAANWIILAATGIVMIGGIIYLARSPRSSDLG